MNLNVGACSACNQKSNHPSFKAIYIKEAHCPWTKLDKELKYVKGMLFNQIPTNVAEKEILGECDSVMFNATGGIITDEIKPGKIALKPGAKMIFRRYLNDAKIFLTNSEASMFKSKIENGSDAKDAFECAVTSIVKPAKDLEVKQEGLLPPKLVA